MSVKRGDPFLPPSDFLNRSLAQVTVGLSGDYWRISHRDAKPIDWSTSDEARFSHPSHKYGGLYIADDKGTCFSERFGQELLGQREKDRAIARKVLAERVWKRISVIDDTRLRILDLRDADTVDAMGADASVFTAGYAITQKWAEQIMQHHDEIDGLIYTSRLNSPQRSLVLFSTEKCKNAVHVTKSPPPPVDDPELLAFLLRKKVAIL